MTVILLAQIQSECQDQAQQNFEPDLDLNCLLMLSTEECDQQKYQTLICLAWSASKPFTKVINRRHKQVMSKTETTKCYMYVQPHDMSSKNKIRQSNSLDPDQPDKILNLAWT